MRVFGSWETGHSDLIHDVAYDYYGRRLATCSSDQLIKVWDFDEEKNEWTLSASWRAHSGSVWKVCWAHPEFGQILASCSFDRTVCIWEESSPAGQPWEKRATLVDSKDTVNDIKFAPQHHGLRLATASGDGVVRIYDAIDVINLAHWPLMDEFEACKGGVQSMSWCSSQFEQPLLCVAANEPAIRIWSYSDASRRWMPVLTLEGHTGVVLDVAWAPSMGRSYHLLASGSHDNKVKIWKLTQSSSTSSSTAKASTPQEAAGAADTTTDGEWSAKAQEVASFDDHHASVWRVSWNVCGTILASSGDDGAVRLWKSNALGQWRQISVISGASDTQGAAKSAH